MKQKTVVALLQAYRRLQQIAAELYLAAELALENDDFDDASLLASRVTKFRNKAGHPMRGDLFVQMNSLCGYRMSRFITEKRRG